MQSNTRVFERLNPFLMLLRDEALRLEQSFDEELLKSNRSSMPVPATCCITWACAVTIFAICNATSPPTGAVFAGRTQAHVLASLNAVLGGTGATDPSRAGTGSRCPVDFRTGPLLLRAIHPYLARSLNPTTAKCGSW